MDLSQFKLPDTGFVLNKTYPYKRYSCFKALVICVLVGLAGHVCAQHRSHEALTWDGGSNGGSNFTSGWGVTGSLGIDAPTNYLKSIYKPAPAYNLGLSYFMNKLTLSANLGVTKFKPQDEFSPDHIPDEITIPVGNDGETTNSQPLPYYIFSNYEIYKGYLSAVYNFDLSESARFYAGANLGGYYVRYTYFDLNNIPDHEPPNFGGKFFYVAPRLGLIFALTDQLGLGVDGSYNFFAPLHKTTESNGVFYTSIAGQVGLTYKF